MENIKEIVRIKSKKMAPLVIDFLISVANGSYRINLNEIIKKHPKYPIHKMNNLFYGLDLKKSNPVLLNSGDRVLRYLVEYGLVKVECILQSEGIYKLYSDIFELQKAKNIVNIGYFEREVNLQLSLFQKN
ncbi:MAG TPA: hypothetical protein PLU67_03340 [Candidatus Kapabacteria bacterium]|nr:hypothetical protein [Candidatus Kapabacteria bacterium]